MPSPPEEEAKPKTDQTSERDTTPPPPSTPQSQTQPQSYPPVMGFPGYPQAPYPNYPNTPYNHQQYAYAQAPPASYYGSSYPPQQNPIYQTPAPPGFFRGILTGLVFFLFVFLSISTTITWLVLRPQIPVFSVTNFSVSNFNLTEPVLSAQWTANLTVENPNTKLTGYFDRIQVFLYNQNAVGEEDYLAMAYFQPVYVETKKSVSVGETLTAGQRKVPSWVGEEMKKERDKGTVSFNLWMAVSVTFKTDGWSARERELKVFCGKLIVAFEGGSGNGAVSLPKPLPCLGYV